MSTRNPVCRNRSVSVEKEAGTFIVRITGDFDSATTPLVHECCKKVDKSAGVEKVVLDFDKAARVDTTAFACIISFIKDHLGTATEIVVTNLHDPEKNLLHMLKVEKIIHSV